MADDYGRGAGIGQHLSRNLSGMSALDVWVAILAPKHDRAACEGIPGLGQQRRGRTDHDIRLKTGALGQESLQRLDLAQARAQPMHLPVTGDERPDCVHRVAPIRPSTFANKPLVLAANPCLA
jgi:hypothetical protein